MKQLINKSLILICLTVVCISLHSCQEEDSSWFPVSGSGEIVGQERTVPAFSKIKSSIAGNITITESKDQQIKVSAQKNLLDLLETEVVNETLYLSFGSHAVETDSLISIQIFLPKLNGATQTGSGNITSELAIPEINLIGSGNVKCAGKTDHVQVKLAGSGVVNLEEMMVAKADVKISGNGNVSLHVTSDLNVTIPGTGVVYYSGLPKIQKNITGTGQVIDKNK
jgi:hypothetical protein